MKTEKIYLLRDLAEKQITRSLYTMVFSDSTFYVDYYYREKCADNVVIIKSETDGEKQTLLSMLHINPYELYFCQKTVSACMIGAVATLPSRRHEGHMRDLIQTAFAYLKEQGVPFCYLVPVDESIYRPFGFEQICYLSERKEGPDAFENADIYCVPNETVQRRVSMEEEIARLEKEEGIDLPGELPDQPVVMAAITCRAAFDELAGRQFDTDTQRLAFLRTKRIYLCDEL